MEFLKKNRVIISRSLGGLMLLLSLILYFFDTPQKTLTQNERALANIARMEAKVPVASTTSKHKDSRFLTNLKETHNRQLHYIIIFFLLLSLGFLGYGFIQRD